MKERKEANNFCLKNANCQLSPIFAFDNGCIFFY